MHSYKKDINSYHLIMEAVKDFDTFYTLKVAPLLDQLAAEKKQSSNSIFKVIVYSILTIASFIVSIKGLLSPLGAITTVALFALTVYTIYKASKFSDKFINDFKQSVIAEVIHYLQPDLVYKPDEVVPEREYRQSGLFRRRYDYYYGDDYIEGVYKGISFHCSEIQTTYLGGRRNTEITIFKGLFFTAKINAEYKGGTYVWIKDEEQFGDSIADERYRLLNFPEVFDMKMHDDIFDKYFFVCSTNPTEARKILDSDMMRRLLEFRKQIKRKVVISFVMGHCYVAIPIEEDLLEPAEDLEDKEAVKKYFFTVLLILSIINQLQLMRFTTTPQ